MSKVHKVVPGDHIPKLAAANGFGDIAAIWDDPKNQPLKDGKRTPCILNPDDEVFIPDKKPRTVTAATTDEHAFTVKRPLVRLRVVLKDTGAKPLAGVKCQVECPGAPPEDTTKPDGKLDEPIAVTAEKCKLVFEDREVELLIGHLTPIEEPSGQRARLNNLGYYAGVDDPSDPVEEEEDVVLRSAIEEFQCDNGMNPPSGVFDDATKKKLLAAHGC